MKKYLCKIIVLLMLFTSINFSFAVYASESSLEQGCGIDNFSAQFTSVEDEIVDINSQGMVTILLFARTNGNCINSSGTISWLCDAEWINDSRIRFVIVDIDKESKETVTKMRDEFNNEKAIFCYCENRSANNLMWDYVKSVFGNEEGITLPLTVLIDSNNKIQYGFSGYQTSNDLLPYVENLVGEQLVDKKEVMDFHIQGDFYEDKSFEVLEAVNEERAKLGLSLLKMDKELMDKAMQRAAECAVYYSHTRPDSSSCYDILNEKYRASCAENIAAGYGDSASVMKGWINSEKHYENIIGDYNNIGVGCFNHNGCTYWVQLFSTYGESEKVKGSNYNKTVVVSTKQDYFGKVIFSYAGKIKEKTITETKLEIENLQFAPFKPALNNIKFSSSNENILCVESDGSLVGLEAGEAEIYIEVNNYLLAAVPVVVEKASGENDNTGNNNDENNNNDNNSSLIKGDVDLNGIINLNDAKMALKFALGIGALPEKEHVICGDLNAKGGIDLSDAKMILKAALGIVIIATNN